MPMNLSMTHGIMTANRTHPTLLKNYYLWYKHEFRTLKRAGGGWNDPLQASCVV